MDSTIRGNGFQENRTDRSDPSDRSDSAAARALRAGARNGDNRAMELHPEERDRNLLFAVLAVQLFHVPPTRLVEVATAWALDPSRELADRLVDAGLLSDEGRTLIWSLVDRTVEAHLGNVVAALETFGGEEQLQQTFTNSILITRDERGFGVSPRTTERIEIGDMPGVPETPGRYSHISEFARGGMGRVFLVHDLHMDREIALKELLPPKRKPATPTPTPIHQALQITARFLQEARVTGRLEHPSIVPVYELGHRADGSVYYTMKLVRGKTLNKAFDDAGSLGARLELLQHFINLCQAVAYAHSRGVLHRDLKPSNVMIGEFGETVLIDWGLAKSKNQPDIHAEPLASVLAQGRTAPLSELEETQYGQVVGTPHYMPPEQARGEVDAIDERSDVYSLGAILYQLLTGDPPFTGDTPREILSKVVKDTPVPVHAREKEAPPEIVAICTRAMQKDAKQRYQTAKELADEVQRYLSGALVQAYRYRFSEHLKRFARQHRGVLSMAGIAAVVLLAVGVYYNVHLYQARAAEREQRIAAQEANRQLEWEYYASALVEAKSNIEQKNAWKATEILQRLPEHHRAWEWGRLLRESDPALYMFPDDPKRGMTGMPMRAIFSQDGRYVLSAHDFGGVKTVFDIAKGDMIYISEVDRFLGWPWCNNFTKDSQALTLGENDLKVVLFDYGKNEVRARYVVESGWLCSLVLSPDERIAAGYRIGPDKKTREVRVWEVATGRQIGQFPLHPVAEPPHDISFWGSMHVPPYGMVLGFLKDSRRLVCTDDWVLVLDTETGEQIDVAPNAVDRVSLASDTEQIVLLTADGALEVWNVSPPEKVKRIELALGGLRNLEVARDGRAVAAAWRDQLAVWDTETGEQRVRYIADSREVESLSFSPNGACVATYGAEAVLRFWDARQDRLRESFLLPKNHGDSSELIIHMGTWPDLPYEFDASVTQLAGGDDTGMVRLWSVPDFSLTKEWKAHRGVVTRVAFSPDGQTLYTASNDGTAKAWRVGQDEPLWTVSAEKPEPVFSVAASPDGSRVAVGFGEDSSVNRGIHHSRVVDAATGKLLFELQDPIKKTTLLAFTPDGEYILAGSWGRPGTDERTVTFYRGEDGTRLEPVVKALGWPLQALPVPNSHMMLLLGTSQEPVLWDLESQREVYRARRYQINRIAVHPDGRRFVGLNDNHAFVFAIEDGRPLVRVEQCRTPVAFTSDGRALLARSPQHRMQMIPSEDWLLTDESVRSANALASLVSLVGITP
ncbi:MAG: protein kinase [Candidatus Hydrogenedentes bacterium]|nr:protein kinase [Candidatus Hydrogenedentota bacterium]